MFHHWDHLDQKAHFSRYKTEAEALFALATSSGLVCGSIVGWSSRDELEFCREHGFSTGALIRNPLDRGMSLLRIRARDIPTDVLTIGPARSPKTMKSVWAIVESVYRRSGRDMWAEIENLKSIRKIDPRHKSIWMRYQFVERFLYNVVKNDLEVMKLFERENIHKFEDLVGSPDRFRDFACGLVPESAIDSPTEIFSGGLISVNRRSRTIDNKWLVDTLDGDLDFITKCVDVIIETFHSHGQDLESLYDDFGYDLLGTARSMKNLSSSPENVGSLTRAPMDR